MIFLKITSWPPEKDAENAGNCAYKQLFEHVPTHVGNLNQGSQNA